MSARPQWEIDAIDALDDARERRQLRARLDAIPQAVRDQAARGDAPKVKPGLGGRKRRARRNRRAASAIRWVPMRLSPGVVAEYRAWLDSLRTTFFFPSFEAIR